MKRWGLLNPVPDIQSFKRSQMAKPQSSVSWNSFSFRLQKMGGKTIMIQDNGVFYELPPNGLCILFLIASWWKFDIGASSVALP